MLLPAKQFERRERYPMVGSQLRHSFADRQGAVHRTRVRAAACVVVVPQKSVPLPRANENAGPLLRFRRRALRLRAHLRLRRIDLAKGHLVFRRDEFIDRGVAGSQMAPLVRVVARSGEVSLAARFHIGEVIETCRKAPDHPVAIVVDAVLCPGL